MPKLSIARKHALSECTTWAYTFVTVTTEPSERRDRLTLRENLFSVEEQRERIEESHVVRMPHDAPTNEWVAQEAKQVRRNIFFLDDVSVVSLVYWSATIEGRCEMSSLSTSSHRLVWLSPRTFQERNVRDCVMIKTIGTPIDVQTGRPAQARAPSFTEPDQASLQVEVTA